MSADSRDGWLVLLGSGDESDRVFESDLQPYPLSEGLRVTYQRWLKDHKPQGSKILINEMHTIPKCQSRKIMIARKAKGYRAVLQALHGTLKKVRRLRCAHVSKYVKMNKPQNPR